MPIAAGTRFGAYEVIDALGAGGMGEIYRARDTSLKPDVAIKVLPAALADDAERLARFQREAEVLASLNHPNIAHLYGLERGADRTGLAMELVEGPTLAERLERGPIPIDEALRLASQVADALEAAHARGIVHRDLPANIKLTPDGTVKVLDFGIAKALDTRAIGGSAPTVLTTPAMTEAGIVLGTAAYMSPEQAKGEPVDERTDVWSYGCVLYEMLTGQPAFLGEDVTSTPGRATTRSSIRPPSVCSASPLRLGPGSWPPPCCCRAVARCCSMPTPTPRGIGWPCSISPRGKRRPWSRVGRILPTSTLGISSSRAATR
jgi:eukaryotic-like serine/threonine-protein kinase